MKSLLLIFIISISIFGATLHITPSDDLQASVDQLTSGDTLYLGGGTYVRDTALYIRGLEGTENSPIVIINEEDEVPHLEFDTTYTVFLGMGSGGHANNVITFMSGCYYVEIVGLELSKGRSGIETWDFTYPSTTQLPDSNITIRDCNIHNNGNVGIRIASNPNFNWKFIHNHIHHTGVHGEGFYIGDNTQPAFGNPHHLEFINNWIHNTAVIPSGSNQGDGIELKKGCHSCIIKNNVIHDTRYPSIFLYNTVNPDGSSRTVDYNNIVYNNFIFNTSETGLQICGTAEVFNNVFFDCNKNAVNGGQMNHNSTYGPLRQAHVFNNTFINSTFWFENINSTDTNIFMNNACYKSASGYAIYLSENVDTSYNAMFKNNITYGTIRNGSNVADGFINSTEGFDAFENKDGFNVYPASETSELVDAGLDMSYLTALASKDFNNNTRTGTWDIGAYEFNSSETSNPGWILASVNGEYMDTLLTGSGLEDFFAGFDNTNSVKITAYPNPFNPSTTIKFKGLTSAKMFNPTKVFFVGIYNVQGRLVENLTNKFKSSGKNSITWNAGNLSAGNYFVRMISGKENVTEKLTLLK